MESVMPSSQLILCHPLLLPPSVFPRIRVFSNELVLHIRWPKDWSFRFSISPSNEYSELISFRMDWLDLLVVQGTLKSLFQHHSSKASILWHSAFFIVQLSHPYMTTRKTIVLTRQTLVGSYLTSKRTVWELAVSASICVEQCFVPCRWLAGEFFLSFFFFWIIFSKAQLYTFPQSHLFRAWIFVQNGLKIFHRNWSFKFLCTS